jgi:hypothetical protein
VFSKLKNEIEIEIDFVVVSKHSFTTSKAQQFMKVPFETIKRIIIVFKTNQKLVSLLLSLLKIIKPFV